MSDHEYTPSNAGGEASVDSWHILKLAGIDVQPGGLSTGDSIAHCRVLDIPHGAMFYVPLNRVALNAIVGQIEKVLREDEQPLESCGRCIYCQNGERCPWPEEGPPT